MNRALRRLVAAEEEARREKRHRLQTILKQRVTDAAAAGATTAASASVAVSSSATTALALVAASSNDDADGATNAVVSPTKRPQADEDGDDDDDDVIEQQKLLASTTAQWRCVEDSQQAVCIAMNRRQTLLAIGEKDGRISIWDNTTMRVITKELDPTSIVLPAGATEASDVATTSSSTHGTTQPDVHADEKQEEGDDMAPPGKRAKTEGHSGRLDDQDGSADGDSATNEEVSVDGNDDASVEADDDDMGGAAMDVDETGSVEDNVSVDENAGDDQGDGDDDDGQDGHGGPPDVHEEAVASIATVPRKLSEGSTPGLTFDELKIAKSQLKHVVSIGWSCDARLLFAGCEEKSTRRGRLCVWDAESAWLLATFSFESAVNAISTHPTNPDLVVVCSYSALPVLLNVRSRERTELAVPIVNATLTVTPPSNSRQPSLVVNCRYGLSGKYIYCATSKSTVAILDSASLVCVDVKCLPMLIQFVDLAVNPQETALVITSSKGVHEFAIQGVPDGSPHTTPSLHETRLHATGAVRAPWALCCFSSDGNYVVGMPIVRHRHVGESGLYTWHRGTGRVQHNLGVKDGVNSISWDVRRDAIVVVSCAGAIHVLEEEFKSEWPGTMYPAGFRLVTDNELDMEAIEQELGEHDDAKILDTTGAEPHAAGCGRAIDVFSMQDETDECETSLPVVEGERRYVSSIPIPQHVKRHHQPDFHIERHFGLGQSVFEPLKSAIKKSSTSSSSKKKKSSSSGAAPDGQVKTAATKSKSKSKSSSSKKRRR